MPASICQETECVMGMTPTPRIKSVLKVIRIFRAGVEVMPASICQETGCVMGMTPTPRINPRIKPEN